MLRIDYLRDHKDTVLAGLDKRHFGQPELVDQALAIDDRRREAQQRADELAARLNQRSKEIGQLFKSGKQQEAQAARAEVTQLKEDAKAAREQQEQAEQELRQVLLELPNIPHKSVPKGRNEKDNEVYQAWQSDLPKLGEYNKPHWELAEEYGLFSLELGVKITGAGFPVYTGKGARLQRALINFFLDRAAAAGYTEYIPPHLVNESSAMATGQLPDKEGQMYYVTEDDLYLIPTAEVPITNVLRGDILPEADLPVKMCGYTPCFRREAGSYGKDVRGLNRVHQFDKVEIVRIEHPDHSYDALHEMVEHVETLLDALDLPYRILRLCGGDMGFTSALTYDFEVWSAAQERWLEVSSVSNFETFQTNRLQLRYEDSDRRKHLAHSLNGSALALARIVAALLENHQSADGIHIPAALQPYTGFTVIAK